MCGWKKNNIDFGKYRSRVSIPKAYCRLGFMLPRNEHVWRKIHFFRLLLQQMMANDIICSVQIQALLTLVCHPILEQAQAIALSLFLVHILLFCLILARWCESDGKMPKKMYTLNVAGCFFFFQHIFSRSHYVDVCAWGRFFATSLSCSHSLSSRYV